MSKRLPLGRLHSLLIALHPSRYRRRFGSDARMLFREWVASSRDVVERRNRARRGVWEALRSLACAWRDEAVNASRRIREWREIAVELMRQGIQNAFRFLWKRPLQAVVVVGTLILALGANTTLFAVARALLIRDLPYGNGDRVVHVGGSAAQFDPATSGWRMLEEFSGAPGVQDAALFISHGWGTLTDVGEATRVKVSQVSENFFDVLGVDLPLGPGLRAGRDDQAVVVISHGLWQRVFGSDPSVLEQSMVLNGRSYRIVGVAPPEVSYPAASEAWLNFPMQMDFFGNAAGPSQIALLRPGVGIPDLESVLHERFEPRNREILETMGFEIPPLTLVPLRNQLVEDVRQPLFVLMGAAALVLILGCLNLAGVWVSRILERRDELGMRRALGASRFSLFWQLISETLTLSLLGGAAALAVSWLCADVLRAQLPTEVPGVTAIGIDPLTLLFALAVTLLAGFGFGGGTALMGARTETLSRGREAARGRESRRLQSMLAIAQGALAVVLVVGASLTVRSFQRLQNHPMGFDPEGSVVMRVRLPSSADWGREEMRAYANALETRIGELPGVRSVGITSALPLALEYAVANSLRPAGSLQEEGVTALTAVATPGYFEAAGIRILDGETFAEFTGAESNEVVIDRLVADSLFPGERAVGRTLEVFTSADPPEWRPLLVRGVSEATQLRGARYEDFPIFYRSFGARPSSNMGIAVRTAGNPSDWMDALRQAVLEVNPLVPPFGVRTMREATSEHVSADRALATVTSGFSLVALLLAGLGLYGLVGRQVTLRRREFGIRLALGAEPRALVGSMTGSGLVIGGAALVLGLPAALFATRFLESSLFEIGTRDPASLALGCLGVLVLSLVAAWLPARRAAKVDPRESLVAE